MKAFPVAGGLALAALGFALGFWAGGGNLPMAGGDPPMRFEAILRIAEPNDRARALADFLDRVEPAEVDGLYEVLQANREQVDEVTEMLFAARWARFDPESAFAGRPPNDWGGRHPWTRAVVREWTHSVPEDAFLAVKELALKQAAPSYVAVTTLVRGWFEHDDADPAQLFDAIEAIETVYERGDAINLFLNSMMDVRGIDATARFVEIMPERSVGFRGDFFGRFVAQVSKRDPAYAYSFALKHADEPFGKVLPLRLAGRWGYEDGPAAMEWAIALPPNGRKPKVVERAYRSFAMADIDEARAWLEERPHTPELEPAWALYALGIAESDPEAALALADRFEDERHRGKVQKAAGRAWMELDASAARAWLESADVSPAIRHAILDPPRRPRPRGARSVDG